MAKLYATHTVCEACFAALRPGREPVRVRDADTEPCCRCNTPTAAGLQVRELRTEFRCQGACSPE